MGVYRILTLDGGGIRGLLTAVILRRLEERVPGWLAQVDLIAGTSTGGILALGLAAGLPPVQLQQLYYDKCDEVFDDSWLDNLLDLGQVIGAQFNNENLARLIDEIVGDITLGELQKKVLIATFDLDNKDIEDYVDEKDLRTWKPKFFQNFPGGDDDCEAIARDVAVYTSAAPSYFPAVNGFIDGGVVANNPSMAALAQVFDERIEISDRPGLHEVRLLSVGTGRPLKYINTGGKKYLDWGYAQWAKPIIEIMMDGSIGVADYQCRQLLGEKKYQRINPVLDRAIDLADCGKTDELIRIGSEYNIDRFVDWLEREWM